LIRAKTRGFPVAIEGLPYLGAFLGLTLLSLLFHSTSLSVFFGIAFLFILQFFRNPNRSGSEQGGVVLSPADGEVILIEPVQEDCFLKNKAIKISIFMNVFNVHVNRAPYSGTVRKVAYQKGRFFAANAEKASSENEQNAILFETDRGKMILFIQIAGLIARRIICYAKEGDILEKGERCGIIKFGSRVDIYLPADTKILIKLKDKVKAGSTSIGILK